MLFNKADVVIQSIRTLHNDNLLYIVNKVKIYHDLFLDGIHDRLVDVNLQGLLPWSGHRLLEELERENYHKIHLKSIQNKMRVLVNK